MKDKYTNINGLKLSTRFLIQNGEKWLRKCRVCKALKEPNGGNFIINGTTTNKILDRTCKVCHDEKIEKLTGTYRVCSKCKKKKEATTQNFRTNRGELTRQCRDCLNPSFLRATKRWQKKHPVEAWRSKVISGAKRRAKTKHLPFDNSAVNQIVSNHIEGSPCPSCSSPMKGKNQWASLDRIDSKKGYEKGNIAIICYRCNFLKSDGSLSEFVNLVNYLKR